MPAANQRISEYVLEERIGGGGFGEVWRAHHHVWTDQLAAVKIPTNPQYIRDLQREGITIHGLVHPNIVRAMGFDPYGDPPYLVMEYVPGTSLRPLIQNKELSVPDAVAVLAQILEALAYAHKNNLVHRDIKPENVLIHTKSRTEGFHSPGAVKVTDFGLGKAVRASVESIALSISMGADEAAKIAGTLDYMAPEQRTGSDVDGRADLYACGVMLYELLTGERPTGTDLPSDINPKVPRHIDEAFRRSYTRLDKRFASAEEFLAALKEPAAEPPPLPPRTGGQPGARTLTHFRGSLSVNDQTYHAVASELARGNKIVAIKVLRGATGCSLADAKDVVENPANFPPGAALPPPVIGGAGRSGPLRTLAGASGTVSVEQATYEAIAADVARGNKIAAIKTLREATGLGLADSKEMVENPANFGPALAAGGPPPVTASDRACPSCRQGVGATDQFCMHCGLQLVAQIRRCPQCGAYPDPTDRFCMFCGQGLASAAMV